MGNKKELLDLIKLGIKRIELIPIEKNMWQIRTICKKRTKTIVNLNNFETIRDLMGMMHRMDVIRGQ
ncbi:hypothetical protein LCGC14_1368690 [marine sediment metagenome]|uniref:Uncharacterized protein n=1 Tax=marine sediment metagenome TaxID=412755 RepID=A0A0F9ML52_9ZZZZ